MKKVISMLLALMLLTALGAAACADEAGDAFRDVGVTLNYPEEFQNLKGVFLPYPIGEIQDGIRLVAFFYISMPEDGFAALMNKPDDEWTQADDELVERNQRTVGMIFSIDRGRGSRELADYMQMDPDDFQEIAGVEDVTFYKLRQPEETAESLSGLAPEYAEEYRTLLAAFDEALKDAAYYKPLIPGSGLVGKILRFETTDVDGNTVKSDDIFTDNAVTMINCWATWCGPCRNELRELAEMNHRLVEKNAAVIGLCLDADTALETCRRLLRENGVDYLNLLPFDNVDETLALEAYPTSFFVDREGVILCPPFTGAPRDMSAYEEIIDSLLKEEADK